MKSVIGLFRHPESRVIIISNLLVLIGVFVFDYSVFSVFILFWAETVVYGIFAFLKQILSKMDVVPNSSEESKLRTNNILYRIFHASLVLAAYFAFMHVHAKFISQLFGPGWYGEAIGGLDLTLDLFLNIYKSDLIWAWFAMILPHLYDFIYRYLICKGRETIPVSTLIMAPWFRVAVLQIAIIISGLIIMLFNEGIPALIVLLFLKTIYDMGAQVFSSNLEGTNKRTKNVKAQGDENNTL